MKIFSDLTWRGLVQDHSELEIAEKLQPQDGFYVGFDPTAKSLQLGNLVPLIVAAHLAKAGLKPYILFGGSTGAIGDPSGKNKERLLIEQKTIEANIKTQMEQVTAIFSRLGIRPTFVNNLDWTKDISYLNFLRDVGKYFTVNYMVAKEVVKSRLDGTGISYAEFSYMLLQAFDFLHLYQNMNCKVQMGGSDQWGNITAGLELIRKKISGEAFAFSFPLVTDSSGKKFGKSEGGAIWLHPDETSPYRLHQFLLNTQDDDAIRYVKMFTFLSESEVSQIEQEMKSAPQERLAQKTLADSVCTLVHGEQATEAAQKSAEVLFGGSIDGLTQRSLEEIFAEVPSAVLKKSETLALTAQDLFVKSNAVASKGEAKRLIAGGGAYINQNRVEDPQREVSEFFNDSYELLILRSGKKKYCLVKLEP